MARVFIDGEVGTTGLQIRDRLIARPDIELVSVDLNRRKDPDARREAFAAADVAILCLPDDAAREAVSLAEGLAVRLIDASTAHRTAPGWVYGFPELRPELREALASARRVANPGCYSTGAIALLGPLVRAGLVAKDAVLTVSAVSGYSGGGKGLIAEFDEGRAPDFFLYALDQSHKHLPEILTHTGLTDRPAFAPSVGRFKQGMAVQVPVRMGQRRLADFHDALAAHYEGAHFVRVVPADRYAGRVVPTTLNGTNELELSVHGSDESGIAVLVAVLDNLGKGASGAAVQNLNLMLGVDEATGL